MLRQPSVNGVASRHKTASPTACEKRSLTVLKWSMSIISAAWPLWPMWLALGSWSSRRRLAGPVNGSSVLWRSSVSARCCSLALSSSSAAARSRWRSVSSRTAAIRALRCAAAAASCTCSAWKRLKWTSAAR